MRAGITPPQAPLGNSNASCQRGGNCIDRRRSVLAYVLAIVGAGIIGRVPTAQRHGEIGILQAALIESCVRHEGRALMAERYRRTRKRLTMTEKLGISKEIGAASDSRDRCLERLDINKAQDANPWGVLDATSQPATTGGPDRGQEQQRASAATQEATSEPQGDEAAT